MLRPKPTCWHSNQREFFAWRLDSSSPLVQHNEFLDVLLQPFQQFSFWSDRKAERHVKERSRNDFQWRFTDDEAKTQWFQRRRNQSTWRYAVRGARREKSSAGPGTSGRPGERRWRTRQSHWHKETRADPPKAQKSNILKWEDKKALSIQNFGNRTAGRYLRTLPAQGNLCRQRIQGLSFKTWSTQPIKTWRRSTISHKRNWKSQRCTRRFRWKYWRQICWCGECYVFVNESSHSSWTDTLANFGDLREQGT